MIEVSRVEETELCNKNHSWESPIYITDRIIDYQVEQLDNMIVADVRKVIETHIDKEALLDALNGSREQYEKGYAEGREDAYHEYKEKLLTIYTALLEAFKGDANALKKIDIIFEEPTEEVKR